MTVNHNITKIITPIIPEQSPIQNEQQLYLLAAADAFCARCILPAA